MTALADELAAGGDDQHLWARRIDAHHPRAELHRHLGAPARDQRAQALGHRILRLGLGLAQEIARRQLAELDTRFQRPDHGIGQPLQRILRHQHTADRHIGALPQGLDQLARGIDGDLLEACVFLLGRLGAADVDRLLQAVGHRPGVHLFQDRHGGIAAAGLDPLGAQIEGKTEGGAVSDGTAADALARLDHQHALVGRHQAFGRGKARDARPDNDDVGIGGSRRKRCSCHQRGQEETTTERHLPDSVCYRAVDGVAFAQLDGPGRDRARRAVACARRDNRAAEGGRRRDARGGQPAARLPRAGGGGAAWPGRPAGARSSGALRLRAAGEVLPAHAARPLRGARSGGAGNARGRGRRLAPGGDRAARRARGHGGAGLARARRNRARHGARAMAVGRRRAGRAGHRPGRQEAPAGRRPRYLEEPAAVGGTAARAAALQPSGRAARGAPAAGPDGLGRRQHRRGAADTERLRLGRRPGLRAARARGPAQRRAGRGRHGRRQDPGLCRAGEPVGREERRAGLDRHLHPQPAAPDRQRARPPAPRFGREAAQGGDPQGPRELSLPAELPGGGDAHRPRARERRRPRPAGALGAQQPRRRHGGRRPAGLAARPFGPRPHHAARRPARRMHLLGVRALPEVLRRTHHPPRPPGRHRDRQPRAGHGAGGDGRPRRRHAAVALRVRRGPSPVRRRRRRLRRASQRHRSLRPQALASGRRGPTRQPRPRPGTAPQRSFGR